MKSVICVLLVFVLALGAAGPATEPAAAPCSPGRGGRGFWVLDL